MARRERFGKWTVEAVRVELMLPGWPSISGDLCSGCRCIAPRSSSCCPGHRSLTKFATRSPQPRANPWNSNAKWPLASFRLKMSQCWLLTSSGGENEGIGWILTPTPGFPISGRQTLLDRAPANRYPLPSLSRSLGNSFWISGGSEQRPMGLRRKRRRYTVTTQSQQHVVKIYPSLYADRVTVATS
jgi:hypothetical protein